MVEAVRIGTIFAHDSKQYRKWGRRTLDGARRQAGLTGMALERAIGSLAATHPEYVVTG